jgi:transcriptional regulator with XRE-family HTH domain
MAKRSSLIESNSYPAWDGAAGMAGGAAFGGALARLAAERDLSLPALAAAAGIDANELERVVAGEARVAVARLARFAQALRLRPLELLQQTELLSFEVYAGGLDPLYFLPQGQVRKDARIYMREINPRHAVPERDMFVRNPSLKEIMNDSLLDDLGKLELELAYLLRTAVQITGGSL